MPTFESIYHLEIYLNEQLGKALLKVMEKVKEMLSDNYQTMWYDRPSYQGNYYKRTYQLKKGLEIFPINKVKISDGSLILEAIVAFTGKDIKAINVRDDNPKMFNSYMSLDSDKFYNNTQITEAIAYWIESGTRNNIYSMPATGVFKETNKKLKISMIQEEIKKILISEGFEFR
jgi:hypothetical protein